MWRSWKSACTGREIRRRGRGGGGEKGGAGERGAEGGRRGGSAYVRACPRGGPARTYALPPGRPREKKSGFSCRVFFFFCFVCVRRVFACACVPTCSVCDCVGVWCSVCWRPVRVACACLISCTRLMAAVCVEQAGCVWTCALICVFDMWAMCAADLCCRMCVQTWHGYVYWAVCRLCDEICIGMCMALCMHMCLEMCALVCFAMCAHLRSALRIAPSIHMLLLVCHIFHICLLSVLRFVLSVCCWCFDLFHMFHVRLWLIPAACWQPAIDLSHVFWSACSNAVWFWTFVKSTCKLFIVFPFDLLFYVSCVSFRLPTYFSDVCPVHMLFVRFSSLLPACCCSFILVLHAPPCWSITCLLLACCLGFIFICPACWWFFLCSSCLLAVYASCLLCLLACFWVCLCFLHVCCWFLICLMAACCCFCSYVSCLHASMSSYYSCLPAVDCFLCVSCLPAVDVFFIFVMSACCWWCHVFPVCLQFIVVHLSHGCMLFMFHICLVSMLFFPTAADVFKCFMCAWCSVVHIYSVCLLLLFLHAVNHSYVPYRSVVGFPSMFIPICCVVQYLFSVPAAGVSCFWFWQPVILSCC